MTAIDFSKALTGDLSVMSFYAKRLLGGGEVAFQKHDFINALQARADAIYPDRLTPQQRFSRCMCDDEIGRLLYKAVKAAGGSEVKTDPEHGTQDYVRPMSEAELKLHVLASDHAKAHSMSYESAYSYLYGHNDHRDLREQIRNESLQRGLEAIHGRGGVSGTLTIGEAQRKAPARSFRGTGYDRDIAEKKLQALADARHAAHPEESAAQSYVRVMLDPKHVEIRKAALAVA